MISGIPTAVEGQSGEWNRNRRSQNSNSAIAVSRMGSSSGGSCSVANPIHDYVSNSCDLVATAEETNSMFSPDDPNKKIRKPYTITKSRESWTEEEHGKFLQALQLFDRDWKKIEAFVGSKTVIQIRSHAQKHFLKVQKNGTSEHVPPPRPKRKATRPYPQKASKTNPPLSQTPAVYANRVTDSAPVTGSSIPLFNTSMPSTSTSKDDVVKARFASSSMPMSQASDKESHVTTTHHVMPDFVQVYSFIGSAFDPDSGDLLQKLKEMDPIDVKTVMLLMRNLSINLACSDLKIIEECII